MYKMYENTMNLYPSMLCKKNEFRASAQHNQNQKHVSPDDLF